jgi:hypothetical protein
VVLYEMKHPKMRIYITPQDIKTEEDKRILLKKRYMQAKKNLNDRKFRQKNEDLAMDDLKGLSKMSREDRKLQMYLKQIEDMEKLENKTKSRDEK